MYVIGSNNTNNFEYKVDFEYELQEWLRDTKLYYTDSVYQEYGEAFIVGISNTCYTMNKLEIKQGYGAFKGNVFEKTEETKYNVKINLNYNGQTIQSKETQNGAFEFINLNKDLTYDLEFIDTTNKYNPKLLKSINPDLDTEQEAKIIKFFDPIAVDKMDYYFGIYAQGEATLSLQNAPSTFSIVKVSDNIYKIVGVNNKAKIDCSIRLDDYREGGLKIATLDLKSK